MPDELIVLVVGAKADLAGTCPTIPLIQAQRSVAVWRDEMERAENGEVTSAPASGFLPKGSNGNTGGANGRSSSPAATRFSRPRTYSTPTSATVPTITTTGPPPTPPHTTSESGFSSRLRYNAMHPPSQSISPPSPRLGASSSSSARPTHTLSSSATMPDLSGYTLTGLPHRDGHLAMNRTASTDSSQSQNSSATSGTTGSSGGHSFSQVVPPPPPGPPSRSSSSFGLMSFLPSGGGRSGGGGGTAAGGGEYGSSSVSSSVATLPGSHHHHHHALTSALTPTRRRSLEDRAATAPSSAGVGALLLRENLSSHSAARRAAAAAEEARLDALVAACPIEVLEVSAKDGFGVEDVFRSIAEQLIEHKAEIERRQQTLRRKDSIILREADAQQPAAAAAAGACAC